MRIASHKDILIHIIKKIDKKMRKSLKNIQYMIIWKSTKYILYLIDWHIYLIDMIFIKKSDTQLKWKFEWLNK